MDTCDLLVPDISVRTASTSSVEQVSVLTVKAQVHREQTPADYIPPPGTSPERAIAGPEGGESPDMFAEEPAGEAIVESSGAEAAQEATATEKDVEMTEDVEPEENDPLEEDPPTETSKYNQHVSSMEQTYCMGCYSFPLGKSKPKARSTPASGEEESIDREKRASSGESAILSGSEFSTVLEAARIQREEMQKVTNMNQISIEEGRSRLRRGTEKPVPFGLSEDIGIWRLPDYQDPGCAHGDSCRLA